MRGRFYGAASGKSGTWIEENHGIWFFIRGDRNQIVRMIPRKLKYTVDQFSGGGSRHDGSKSFPSARPWMILH
jgi:hypothetical protein